MSIAESSAAEYSVPVFREGSRIDWRKVPAAPIGIYPWGGEYRPRSYARLAYLRNDGFYARLTSHESDPKAEFLKNMDPVYTDSCLEFFASFRQGYGYINCEMNANGAVLAAYGLGRENRTPLDLICGRFPEVSARKYADRWQVTARIGCEMLAAVYGRPDFDAGDLIYGNFYKCGDGCAVPHYGVFSPVLTERPDFHRPEFFAPMRLAAAE